MFYENKCSEKGPVGKWEAESARSVSFLQEATSWINAKWEKSSKIAEYYYFYTSWRIRFETSLTESKK